MWSTVTKTIISIEIEQTAKHTLQKETHLSICCFFMSMLGWFGSVTLCKVRQLFLISTFWHRGNICCHLKQCHKHWVIVNIVMEPIPMPMIKLFHLNRSSRMKISQRFVFELQNGIIDGTLWRTTIYRRQFSSLLS